MNTTFADCLTALLRRLLTEFISHPEKLSLQSAGSERSLVFYLSASGEDTPRIIGAKGALFRALSAVAEAAGAKAGVSVRVDRLREPADETRSRYADFVGREDWPRERLLDLLGDVASMVFADDLAIAVFSKDGLHFNTDIDLLVSEAERPQLVADMAVSLGLLFRSIGKPNGRQLSVRVLATQPATVQPRSAAGRVVR